MSAEALEDSLEIGFGSTYCLRKVDVEHMAELSNMHIGV